jgi:hypothetical protein
MTLRKWATTTNYTTGVDTGTPTCVDPGAGVAAEGFVPHEGVPAQHVNSLFHDVIQALFDLSESPEAFVEIRDDFIGCSYDGTTKVLHSAYHWEVSSTIGATPSTAPPLGFGTVSASLLATEEFEIELAGDQNSIQWGLLQEASFRVRVTSTDLNNAELFIGLAENHETIGVGNNAVGLWLDEATSPNWLIRHKVGGVDDATNSTTFFGSGVWVTMKLRRISATQVEVYLFGDLVATLTDGTTGPADGALMTLGWFATAGTAAAMTPEVDLIYVKMLTPNRTT